MKLFSCCGRSEGTEQSSPEKTRKTPEFRTPDGVVSKGAFGRAASHGEEGDLVASRGKVIRRSKTQNFTTEKRAVFSYVFPRHDEAH